MKKNMLLIISILFIGFFAFAISAKAVDCSAGSCYCNDAGDKCSVLRNPRGIYTKKADMTKCGCKPTGQNPPANGGSGSLASSGDGIELCQNAGLVKAFQIVGWCIFVLKIMTPIVLIVVGSITLGQAVVSSDDKAIKSAVSGLVKKAIAAVVIFFIPTIVMFVFSLVAGAESTLEKYSCLTTCLSQPSQCPIPANDLFN